MNLCHENTRGYHVKLYVDQKGAEDVPIMRKTIVKVLKDKKERNNFTLEVLQYNLNIFCST